MPDCCMCITCSYLSSSPLLNKHVCWMNNSQVYLPTVKMATELGNFILKAIFLAIKQWCTKCWMYQKLFGIFTVQLTMQFNLTATANYPKHLFSQCWVTVTRLSNSDSTDRNGVGGKEALLINDLSYIPQPIMGSIMYSV